MDILAAMRAFVAIVDEGSLTAAGAALDRAPPTMVRTLASLEKELGVRLLVRTTRQMALTEEGRVYLDRCRRILSEVDDARLAISASDPEPHGELRVTAPVLFGQRHVAPAITQYVRRYPKVQVELLLLDRVVHLVEEGLDIGVRIGQLEDSSMISVPVGHVRTVVVASPSFLSGSESKPTSKAEHAFPRTPHDLSKRPCVVHYGTAPNRRWTFRNPDVGRIGLETVTVESRFSSNQASSVVEACVAGIGFGRFLSYQVEPQIRDGRLVVLLEEFEPEPLPVQLVYPDARLMSPRLRTFIDFLKADLRKRPEIRDKDRLQETRDSR